MYTAKRSILIDGRFVISLSNFLGVVATTVPCDDINSAWTLGCRLRNVLKRQNEAGTDAAEHAAELAEQATRDFLMGPRTPYEGPDGYQPYEGRPERKVYESVNPPRNYL